MKKTAVPAKVDNGFTGNIDVQNVPVYDRQVNIAERIILKEIILTGDIHGFNEFYFKDTAHKFIMASILHVQGDKIPIGLKTVCRCLCDCGLEEFAKTAESLFNEGDLWIPPM
ncbi:hypothetical protein FACS1894137_04050 [Spirochaetia bacterium]|nr:hypothetical protein FACS1894137_04050 [Spirochaetia bacterium]